MFATRDQENLVHARQTTAAGKPLNQGIRSLNPKTPANVKTPFRTSKNDENLNLVTQGQKTLLNKGGSKLNQNAFVTPAAPKSRAPLGAKTTNAKAQPLKTPGFAQTVKQQQTTKKLSTARRSTRKITIAPTEPLTQPTVDEVLDTDEPDFGYAPPPIKELPDPPIEFGYDEDFPQFRPENMFKGYGEIFFGSPKDEQGLSLRLKKEQEQYDLSFQERQRKFTESITRQQSERVDPDAEVDRMIAAGPISKQDSKQSRADTISAKSAASALSTTTRTKANSTIASTGKGSQATKSMPIRSRAPLSVSKNTIGFPKAKQPPSIIPKSRQAVRTQPQPQQQPQPNQNDIHPTEFVRLYGEPPVDSEMWFRLKQHELLQQESDDLFGAEPAFADSDLNFDLFSPEFDDEGDIFQLPVPEEC